MKKLNEFDKRMDKMLSESIKEASLKWDKDKHLMININTYPWYFEKMDSTHFKMANNIKALSTGAAMVHHVGQHRGETYYKDLVNWLHGKIDSKKLQGKGYAGNG